MGKARVGLLPFLLPSLASVRSCFLLLCSWLGRASERWQCHVNRDLRSHYFSQFQFTKNGKPRILGKSKTDDPYDTYHDLRSPIENVGPKIIMVNISKRSLPFPKLKTFPNCSDSEKNLGGLEIWRRTPGPEISGFLKPPKKLHHFIVRTFYRN